MFFRLPRLTPGYIRYLQTQAHLIVPLKPPAGEAMPRVAVLMGALGVGMCGYSSRQLTLHHRPSARVLQWVHTQGDVAGAVTQRAPVLDVTQDVPQASFAGQKIPSK